MPLNTHACVHTQAHRCTCTHTGTQIHTHAHWHAFLRGSSYRSPVATLKPQSKGGCWLILPSVVFVILECICPLFFSLVFLSYFLSLSVFCSRSLSSSSFPSSCVGSALPCHRSPDPVRSVGCVVHCCSAGHLQHSSHPKS